jgi:hypothetical protein
MKFLWYFFLIFQIGIKGEPSSLSFINLIPSIIANGRFVKENIIDSNSILNQTFPSINIDLTFNVNGSNCSRDIQLLYRDFLSRQIWALKSNLLLENFFFILN